MRAFLMRRRITKALSNAEPSIKGLRSLASFTLFQQGEEISVRLLDQQKWDAKIFDAERLITLLERATQVIEDREYLGKEFALPLETSSITLTDYLVDEEDYPISTVDFNNRLDKALLKFCDDLRYCEIDGSEMYDYYMRKTNPMREEVVKIKTALLGCKLNNL